MNLFKLVYKFVYSYRHYFYVLIGSYLLAKGYKLEK